ncbi:cAMP-dependent protein kinase-like, putative [Talaromyces stipitatus ATCC 10500]|uniref:non-specific serine/threonine protein kinase n=1 Tax=Talaromyces stipitatus (strain ATCC 10500 / CBS 375.48 / QM 6759 / NRRL 1006) TaxID=441959 RepID=B8M6Q0_TALSN|nr:cAMP-dependent protein kinase-like, putative [Talaromyces stipitatus ATCC 10500]EED19512.1 cAMP-dependent protein kinase-like, putative [Talaromyces stipitatus ATCC 10500]
MAAPGGINPHSDADLMRQAVLQNGAAHEDDHPDNIIGSNGSTPSGIITPQPDPADKRLPSIIHYFSQVGNSAFPLSSLKARLSGSFTTSVANATTAESDMQSKVETVKPDVDGGSGDSPSSGANATEKHLENQDKTETTETFSKPTSLPTPPYSSACSLSQKDMEEMESTAPTTEKTAVSIYSALKDYMSSTSSNNNASELHSSRPPTCDPVSSISDDPVLASHFSNPSLPDASDLPPPPAVPLLDHEKPYHISKSSENLAKLTESAANPSHLKNTPPLTPRAMSNDNSMSSDRQSNGSTSAPSNSSNQRQSRTETPEDSDGKSSDGGSSSDGPAVAPLKGKLSVKISRARGLRPSTDPYVVCVFEWNEYISKGTQSAAQSPEGRAGDKDYLDNDSGRPMAIPMKSRQSSHNSQLDNVDLKGRAPVTDPQWNHEAVFDVMGEQSEIDISVYDRYNQEAFLGHVRMSLNLREERSSLEGWFPLTARGQGDFQVSGEIHLEMHFERTEKKQVGPNDFQILKLIGKGTFGQVYQVKKKDTQRIYAMKVLSKKVIIQKKEVAHTLGERNILVRTAMAASPFIVGLKFSFQTPTDLYLVTDYMSGGELFWHLQKEGRFQEARAKFYIAELILALQHLHDHDIVYRDLKPENILLDANGHIALCDFGLSKANLTKNDTTNTFCGTTEYLAPEVLLDEQGYTKMVDFWSLGVLVFEMCCGWSPFYAEDTQQMYKNIAFGKVRFPRDALSTEGRNFVKGLLNRNPKHRLGAKDDAKELIAHPFFHDIDWQALSRKEVIPPFKPKLKSESDTSNFDPEFTTALDHSTSLNDRAAALANGLMPGSTPLSPGMQANFKGFTFVNESSMDHHLKDNSADRMDEDIKEDDSWHRPQRSVDSTDRRMSGVVKTGEGEGGVFNNFDI